MRAPQGAAAVAEDRQRTARSRLQGVLDELQERLAGLPVESSLRHFLGTYRRTTVAVGEAIDECAFEDPGWVDGWDAEFAQRYLDAFDARIAASRSHAPGAWRSRHRRTSRR